MSGQATPGRDIFAGARIRRRDPQYLSGFHPAQPQAQFQHEIPTRHIAGVPSFAFA
jgi:hypothetical protein